MRILKCQKVKTEKEKVVTFQPICHNFFLQIQNTVIIGEFMTMQSRTEEGTIDNISLNWCCIAPRSSDNSNECNIDFLVSSSVFFFLET